MRLIALYIAFLFLINTVSAGEKANLKSKPNQEDIKKVDPTNKMAPKESYETVLAIYESNSDVPGRQLKSKKVATLSQADLQKTLCSNPVLTEKFKATHNIADNEVRLIVIAAILDDAEKFDARDTVLNGTEVKSCL